LKLGKGTEDMKRVAMWVLCCGNNAAQVIGSKYASFVTCKQAGYYDTV